MKKKILSVAVIATMLSTLFTVPGLAKDFPDTTGHWAENAVSVWSDRGVVNGDDAGNFRPGDSITRAETAKLMDNLIGFQKTSNKVFSDVGVNDWYAEPISKLYAAGVITGYEDGTIRPGASISRQEAAVIIGRAFSVDTKNADQNILSQFGDSGLIQDWAKPVVAFMAERGFIQGSDGQFRPGDPITRAEVVTILNNMVGIYADGSQGSYTGNYGNQIAVIKEPVIFNGVVLGGAVVCASAKGKVNFNSGSKVNGCLCNWSANISVSTAGATVFSSANKNGGTITAGGNYNASYGGGTAGGSYGGTTGGNYGGTAGGSTGSTTRSYEVVYNANSGRWTNPSVTKQTITYPSGYTYGMYMPQNPIREGYQFMGWYVGQDAANSLNESAKIENTDSVNYSSNKYLYAGWKALSGLYGTLTAATAVEYTNAMKNVTVTETSTVDSFTVTGGLHELDNYAQAPGLEKSGNFLALTYTLPDSDSVTAEDVTVAFSHDGDAEPLYKYLDFTDEKRSYTKVFRITKEILEKDILVAVDLDGDGTAEKTLTADISQLVLYRSETVNDIDKFKEALADNTVEKITVEVSITLPEGTYAPATGSKTVILKHPLLIAKDASVTLENLAITAGTTLTSILANTTEGDPATATKAAALTLKNIQAGGDQLSAVLNQLKVTNLTVKNCTLSGDTGKTSIGLSLAETAVGDMVVIEGNAFKGFDTAILYADAKPLTTEGNSLKQNRFTGNTTDIKIGIDKVSADAIPNVAYNYFDDAPVILGSGGEALDVILYPTYTNTLMGEADLSENTHDAFVFVDGELEGKLSAVAEDDITLTFSEEEPSHTIVIVPTDVRDTVVKLNDEEKNSITLTQSYNLTVQVGNDTPKVITVQNNAIILL